MSSNDVYLNLFAACPKTSKGGSSADKIKMFHSHGSLGIGKGMLSVGSNVNGEESEGLGNLGYRARVSLRRTGVRHKQKSPFFSQNELFYVKELR